MLWVLPALVMLRLATAGSGRDVDLREALATIVAVLPFLAVELRRLILYRAEQDAFSWLSQLSPMRVAEILGEQWFPFAKAVGWPVALAGAAALLALLWLVRGPMAQLARRRPLQAMLVALLLLSPFGLWLIGEIAAPVAMPRTFLPASIGFAALAGAAVASLRRPAAAAVGIAAVGVSLASTVTPAPCGPRSNGRLRPRWPGIPRW